ncbi:transglycosylase domain-containing protein [Kitasatospora sp. NPDC048540]|uniref:transglycosylase domain-containing protein n=1 Tax=unclassified Kitasatospora TaxID=2633591 RepID=UPI000B022B5F|nr:transglycosylase domain-containing protein [Kitasatospora sp. MBT63]
MPFRLRALAASARSGLLRLPGRMSWDYPRTGRRGVRRWLPSWRQWLVLTAAGALGLVALIGVAYARTDIPEDLNAFATQQNNVYYWADGTEMARTGLTNRQDVPLDQVPGPVKGAVLAAENATFYSDHGVSPSGIARALYRTVSGGDTQGGSTITQQYVKNAYLNQDRTLSRKFTEVLLAVKLDRHLDKDEILAGYLNTSWFGRGSYGIQRAAHAYYGKDVSQLDPSEGAMLAALLKGAGLYDPALGPAAHQRAVERWSWILDRMVETGALTAAQRAGYTVFPEPRTPEPQVGMAGQVGYLVEVARSYVESHSDITPAQFDLGGHQIYTTFEKPRTTALAAAVGRAGAGLSPDTRAEDRYVRVGATSVAADGRILALYGGPDYLKQGFNNANTSNVPVGSAFGPLVYAAGLGQGVQRERGGPRTPVLPGTLYDGDDGVKVMTPEGPYWGRDGKIVKGRNAGGRSWGKISLHTAVAQAVNTPIMQLGMDVGLDKVRRTALDLGLLPDSTGPLVPAFSLGNSTPSTIRMAGAYSTFASGGRHTDPYSVLKVTRGGADLPLRLPPTVTAITPQVAAEVTDALTDAVKGGSAAGAQAVAPGAAGTSGTSQDNTAGWFVGTAGTTSTAVVVFRMDPKTLVLQPLDGLGGGAPAMSATGLPLAVWSGYQQAAPAG